MAEFKAMLRRGTIAIFAIVFTFSFDLRAGKTDDAEAVYAKVKLQYLNLSTDAKARKLRHKWEKVISDFIQVSKKFPGHQRAGDSIFMAARASYDLFRMSSRKSDLDRSVELFETVSSKSPESRLSDDSLYNLALIHLRERGDKETAARFFERIISGYPKGDMFRNAKLELKKLTIPDIRPDTGHGAGVAKPPYDDRREAKGEVEEPPLSGGPSIVKDIKHWSNPDYTRVIICLSAKAPFDTGEVPVDADRKLPRRVYVDIRNAAISKETAKTIDVKDSLLERVRTAQHSADAIRVVLDLKTIRSYRVFAMDNPAQIVIDVFGAEKARLPAPVAEKESGDKKPEGPEGKKPEENRPVEAVGPPAKSVGGSAHAKPEEQSKSSEAAGGGRKGGGESLQTAPKEQCVKRIAIDAGHGGGDPGAMGKKKLKEKDVVLDVATMLRKMMEDELEIEVVMTRIGDESLELSERTAIANQAKADLFVSIHANATTDRTKSGVEVFYFDITDDRYAKKLAAKENAISETQVEELKYILADLKLNAEMDESMRLAGFIQKAMVASLSSDYKDVKDLGVKYAPFYVLFGANMPAVLVETSFISNAVEEKRLGKKEYRERLARGILSGLKAFIEDSLVAYRTQPGG